MTKKDLEYYINLPYTYIRERHYRLAKQAKLYGKSINAFIDEAISEKLKQSALQ